MSGNKRVVLVKPGDVLVLGNVGHEAGRQLAHTADLLGQLKEHLGLAAVVVFAEDVDIDAIPADALRERDDAVART